MRKLFVLVLVLCCFCVVQAQTPDRETEWQNYKLPTTDFTRYTLAKKEFVFRVPASWKREGETSTFAIPGGGQFLVFRQEIPNGIPLQEYFNSLLRSVKSVAAGAGSITSRRTRIQDIEARELTVEGVDPSGNNVRSLSWVVVKGPAALMVNLSIKMEQVAELEPYFKAIIQSVMFVPFDYARFEKLRTTHIKDPKPGPINGIEEFVAAVDRPGASRGEAIDKLATVFTQTPDLAVDLLLDNRSLVRAATVQALTKSNNRALDPFLWYALDDFEPIVSEPAAQRLAEVPDFATELLKNSRMADGTEAIARVWAFMTPQKRIELLKQIFNKPATQPVPPVRRGIGIGSGPPPGIKFADKVEVKELVVSASGQTIEDVLATTIGIDANVQLGALTLLRTTRAEEFKLPLAQLMAANYDPLVITGLEVALDRKETLPLDLLFKLVASKNEEIKRLAIQNLGLSAAVTDIPKIEALKAQQNASANLQQEVKNSIDKINFRTKLASSSAEQKKQIIDDALKNPELAQFAWDWTSGNRPTVAARLPENFKVAPLGENILPNKVAHYLATPNAAAAVQKFYETLEGIQMDSARAQSNLVLMMGSVREQIANGLGAPTEAASIFEYSGLAPNSAIAVAQWDPKDAPTTAASAIRTVLVCRVADRERFERLLQSYQKSYSLPDLATYSVLVTRGVALAPAMIPLIGQTALAPKSQSETSDAPMLKYSLIRHIDINGLPVRVFETSRLNAKWKPETSSTYLAYIGDTAVLTSNVDAMREVIANANASSENSLLASNPQFRNAAGTKADVVYFSEMNVLSLLFQELGMSLGATWTNPIESGNINFANTTWLNTHHLELSDIDWFKSFQPFQPKDLSAPKDLLPASTIAYFSTKLEPVQAWTFWSKSAASATTPFALDLKTEVLPELGPEFGVAVLDPPRLVGPRLNSWLLFGSLKSAKLRDAFTQGKLFTNVGPTSGIAELKWGGTTYFAAIKNNFLLIASTKEAIARLDEPKKLNTTRDFAKAADKVTGEVVAFGGYNLEAAIAASRSAGEGLAAQQAEVIFSIAGAFHSQSFSATASAGTIEAQSSVSMDREGRYGVAEFSNLPEGRLVSFGILDPGGKEIIDQQRVSNLVLRIKTKGVGTLENLREDVNSAEQKLEQKAANELLLTVAARRTPPEQKVTLPVTDPQLAQFVNPSKEITSTEESVVKQAREIAGDDKDAWSVARKLADWTHTNLQWRFVAVADAKATLASREADCSEFSQLFVSMARSLGLPARMVTGMAYSGRSFGGHAWVEVWIGRWVELDPTWGTDFVDATHIRSASGALISSASLNLLDVEVLEAKRTAAPFHATPELLAKELLAGIAADNPSALEASIDISLLTDRLRGPGSWDQMTAAEREMMSSASSRLAIELTYGLGKGIKESADPLRLLRVETHGETAQVFCLTTFSNLLIRMDFIKHNNEWYLAEVEQTDNGVPTIHETVMPYIEHIEEARSGKKSARPLASNLTRVIIISTKEPAKAIEFIEGLPAAEKASQRMRFLKATAYLRATKVDEGIKLLTELSTEQPAYPPALKQLAIIRTSYEKYKDTESAIKLLNAYAELVPFDPRPHKDLADLFEGAKQPAALELHLRKAIELDRGDIAEYARLIAFLVSNKRTSETAEVFKTWEKEGDNKRDLFGNAVQRLAVQQDSQLPNFVALYPQKLKGSFSAHTALANFYKWEKNYPEALRLLGRAKLIDPESTHPYNTTSEILRHLKRWPAALKEANKALPLDEEDAETYYELACSLAKLRRINEALTALEKSIELSDYFAEDLAGEEDLKPLANHPRFKKLLPKE